jgi:hypothetical protein
MNEVHDTNDPLIQIIYTSTAVALFSKDQLKTLLTTARRNNHALQVSGMLVYDDGFFMQVLEGPERVVDGLYASIEKNPRHDNIRLLLRHRIKEKEYEEWSMGFVDTSELATQIEGFVQYRTLRGTIQDEARAKKLIQKFQEGLWRHAVKR